MIAEIEDAAVMDRLWQDYKTSGDSTARDRLIVHYSPLVKFVAGRMAAGLPQSVDQGDLVSYGIFGLIGAIEKFEPSRGFKFESYAMARIKGAIIDELRSIDWVPRSVRAKARSVERACASLEHRLRRTPTDTEVAEEMGVSREELQQVFSQISSAGLVSLDEMFGGSEGPTQRLGDTVADLRDGPTSPFEAEEMKHILARAINRLAERERNVLTLYYYEGLTLAQIGKILGVTPTRVCQIRTKAELHLRCRITATQRESA